LAPPTFPGISTRRSEEGWKRESVFSKVDYFLPIDIPLPNQHDRVKMFQILINSSKVKVSENVNFEILAKKMDGYSCSDISTVVRDALMTPMREMMARLSLDEIKNSKEEIRLTTLADFESALSKVNSSINQKLIEKYDEWFKTYGST
jgi:katanin p60 ATPase-containing subunit A1